MKKILGLTIAIVLIIGVVATGTWAIFSDTETLDSRTFTAGIIDLEIESSGTVVFDGELTDIKPCQTGYLVVTLKNGVDAEPEEPYNQMHIWKFIEINSAEENGISGPEQDWYTANPSLSPKNDIDRYIHFDMWIAGDYATNGTTYTPADDTMLIDEATGYLLSDNLDDYSALVPTVVNTTDNGVVGYWIYLGTLDPGSSMVIVQSFHLDASVDNWAQSDCLTFTETFFALQTAGSPDVDDLPDTPGTGLEFPVTGLHFFPLP